MTLIKPKDWIVSIVAVIFAIMAVTYSLITKPIDAEVEAIQFSDLSNAELDAMLVVKAEMIAANDL